MIWKGVKKQMRLIGNEKKVGVGKEQVEINYLILNFRQFSKIRLFFPQIQTLFLKRGL